MKEKIAAYKVLIKEHMTAGAEKRKKAAEHKADEDGDKAHSVNMSWNWKRRNRRKDHLTYCYLKGRTYKQAEHTCAKAGPVPTSTMANDIFKDPTKRDLEQTRIEKWIVSNLTRRQLVADSMTEEERQEMLQACVAHHESQAEHAEQLAETSRKSAADLKEKLQQTG